MTNRESEAPDKQLPDASTVSAEIQDCAKFFCTTLASLNKISEEYFAGLLKLVISAAEASRSLSTPNQDTVTQSTIVTKGDGLTTLVEELRRAHDGLNQSNTSQHAEITENTLSADTKTDTFCSQVEAILIVAMRNSVNAQQQAYVTGQAAITIAVTKILSLPLPKNSD
jgi:hypothetical protein